MTQLLITSSRLAEMLSLRKLGEGNVGGSQVFVKV